MDLVYRIKSLIFQVPFLRNTVCVFIGSEQVT